MNSNGRNSLGQDDGQNSASSGGDDPQASQTSLTANQPGNLGGQAVYDASQGRQGQVQGQTGGMDKEVGPIASQGESVPITEVRENVEKGDIPLEVREYVEKVDKENLELKRAVVHKGQPVVEPAGMVSQPSVMVPMTRGGILAGIKQHVTKSVRWLSEWCVMIIKKFRGRAVYRQE